MSKKILLIFAIITLVVGAIFMTIWALILTFHLALEAQFPGVTVDPIGVFFFYFFLSVGIALIVVSIILFILRAKRNE